MDDIKKKVETMMIDKKYNAYLEYIENLNQDTVMSNEYVYRQEIICFYHLGRQMDGFKIFSSNCYLLSIYLLLHRVFANTLHSII